MRIVGLTNLIVDFYIYNKKILINGGGTVANILANLSFMGTKTCVYGYYANDILGKFAKNELTKVGVDTNYLKVKEYKTKCFFIDQNGTSSTCPYCKQHRKNYKTRKGIEKFLKSDDIVLVQDVHNLPDIENKIIWDFGYTKGIVYMDNIELSKLIFRKYFIVNFKKQVLELALKKLRLTFTEFIKLTNIEFMIITDGKNGSTLIYKDKEYKFIPEMIEEVETNGCGDMYLATFINEILKKNKNFNFKKINEKAQKNVCEVLKRIGARDYISPNVEIDYHKGCICEDFIIK